MSIMYPEIFYWGTVFQKGIILYVLILSEIDFPYEEINDTFSN